MGSLGDLILKCIMSSEQKWPTVSPLEEALVIIVGAASVCGEIRLSCCKHSSKCGHDSLVHTSRVTA